MRLLIFSDLDGTLLDHNDYGFEAALPALELIRAKGWPLVFVTSKTRSEVEELRERMQVDEPFVVENGGGVFFPERYHHLAPHSAKTKERYRMAVLGLSYAEVRAFVEERGRDLGIQGFGDMDDATVARLTGLPTQSAGRARTRDFTEPFVLADGFELEPIVQEAAGRGISVTTGGRFHHLIGSAQDKGRAVELVRDTFASHWGTVPKTVGLGDGMNDLPMLYAVDFAVVIPAHGRSTLRLERDDARTAPAEGPRGWSAALLELVQTLEQAADA